MYKDRIQNFFNKNYTNEKYYWWKTVNRYSTNEEAHTLYNSKILRIAKCMGGGKALDLGAGEGADAIRLAKLGFEVDVVDISSVAGEKIREYSRENHVYINVICQDIEMFEYKTTYDIIICNGVLHYLDENAKKNILFEMQNHTNSYGVNCISLFSTYSPVPSCHQVVAVFPEAEGGDTEKAYQDWDMLFLTYEREKSEASHNDMTPHIHSFIKFIAKKRNQE